MYVQGGRAEGFLLTTGTILCIKTGLERSFEEHGFEMRMFVCGQGRERNLTTSIHYCQCEKLGSRDSQTHERDKVKRITDSVHVLHLTTH